LYILKVKSERRKGDAKTRIALFGLQDTGSCTSDAVRTGLDQLGNRIPLPPQGAAACEKIVSATLPLVDEHGGEERETQAVVKSID
jgi:hypothetical protein